MFCSIHSIEDAGPHFIDPMSMAPLITTTPIIVAKAPATSSLECPVSGMPFPKVLLCVAHLFRSNQDRDGVNSILTVALNGCRLGHTSNVGHTGTVKRLQRLAFDFDRKRERATKKWSGLSRQFALSGGSAAGIATRIFTGLQAHAEIGT